MIGVGGNSPMFRLLKSDARTITLSFAPEDGYETPPMGSEFFMSWVIPEGMFTPEEIEELRRIDDIGLRKGEGHFIANFIPDPYRPADVPPM